MAARLARHRDIPALVDLARQEFEALRVPLGRFVAADTERTFARFLCSSRAAVFIATDGTGYLIAMETWAPTDYDFRFGMDAGFFSSGSSGRALVEMAEEWARRRGLAGFALKRYNGYHDGAVDRAYRRRAFAPMEHWYFKRFD